jgi:hypothetical protein
MAVEIKDVEQVAQDLQQNLMILKRKMISALTLSKLKKASWPEKLKHLTAS